MTTGIYGYWDNKKGYYAYIGKDSNIDAPHNRDYMHNTPSKYDTQPFNSVLQNNPDRYEYRVLMEGDYNDKQLNKMERFCIKHLKTYRYDYPDRSVFNFTEGGEGTCGYKHSEETRKKLRESMTGRNHSEETRKKLSELGIGRKFSKETRKKISESKVGEKNPAWKDYPRIIKYGVRNEKQIYCIRYNGKNLKQSIYIERLEDWFNDNFPNEELIKEV